MRDSKNVAFGLMFDLLVVGDTGVDLVLRGDVRPRFGQEEQLLSAGDLVLGGSSTITAAGCARLGLRTRLLAATGADLFGSFVRDRLAERGVELAVLSTVEGLRTGFTVVLSTEDDSSAPADRSLLTMPGALLHLGPDDVTDEILATAPHLHVGAIFLQPRLAAGLGDVFARAKARGVTTSLDTNWDPSGAW